MDVAMNGVSTPPPRDFLPLQRNPRQKETAKEARLDGNIQLRHDTGDALTATTDWPTQITFAWTDHMCARTNKRGQTNGTGSFYGGRYDDE